jgi:hypothetical protein
MDQLPEQAAAHHHAHTYRGIVVGPEGESVLAPHLVDGHQRARDDT